MLQRRFVTIVIAGIAALFGLAALIWLNRESDSLALSVLDPLPDTQPTGSTESSDRDANQPLDESVFAARLWNPPPERVVEPDDQAEELPPRRLPPPQVELVAITTKGSERIAALFDPKANDLYMLRTGDEVQGYAIEAIEETTVVMVAGQSTHRITLIHQGGER